MRDKSMGEMFREMDQYYGREKAWYGGWPGGYGRVVSPSTESEANRRDYVNRNPQSLVDKK